MLVSLIFVALIMTNLGGGSAQARGPAHFTVSERPLPLLLPASPQAAPACAAAPTPTLPWVSPGSHNLAPHHGPLSSSVLAKSYILGQFEAPHSHYLYNMIFTSFVSATVLTRHDQKYGECSYCVPFNTKAEIITEAVYQILVTVPDKFQLAQCSQL